jgi:ABC-type dipeptide/oligopeptide/nickel transport system permease component
MGEFIVRRIWQGLVVLLLALTAVFFLVRLTGDPTLLLVPQNSTQQEIAQLRHAFGFDQPPWRQYLRFVSGAVRGDFGNSIMYNQPASSMVLERLPDTAELAAVTLAIIVLAAVPLGVIAATHRNSWWDTGSMVAAMVGQSMPSYWLGIMLILLFAVRFGWLPAAGKTGWSSVILPAVTLSAYSAARLARVVRSEMLDVLGREFVRTARAKGLPGLVVLGKHAMRNALIPVVTLLGLETGFLLGGAIIVETVFAWPGIGNLVIQAVNNRDYPVVQMDAFLMAGIFVLANLGIDLLYGVLDPRVRYE